MKYFRKKSLKNQLILLNAIVAIFVLSCIVAYVSMYSHEKLEKSIYLDMKTKNEAYSNTILSTFEEKAQTLLTLRDDLENYDTLGQIWVHLASHTGEKIFSDTNNKKGHINAFYKKLNTYKQNGQLSSDKMTPQIKKMYDNIKTKKYAFGKGMKFFYVGLPIFNKDKTLQLYDQYQDSSLWVPDSNIEEAYNPLVRPWYLAGQKAGRQRVFFTEPYAERRTKEAVVSIATAIDVNGIRGTLASAISIKPIIDKILSKFQENTHIAIFSKGVEKATTFVATPPKYIYSSRDISLGQYFKTYNDKDIIKSNSNKNLMDLYDYTKDKKSGIIEWNIDNEERLVAYDTVPMVDWKIFISISKKEKMKEDTDLQYKITLIGIFGILFLITCLYFIVNTLVSPINKIGKELKEIANTGDLSKRISQVNTNEIDKIARDINQMLDNTAYPVKKLSKFADKIARDKLKTKIDVVAKGDIANLVNSFSLMTKRLIELEAKAKDASPLTGLPGGISIEKITQEKINDKIPFVFCMFDIDNFKSFNDNYGYSQGNLVIKKTAEIIRQVSQKYGDDFVGHIGGDDFVLISKPDNYETICKQIITQFDNIIKNYYNEKDKKRGYIISQDRQGNTLKFPFMTISISAINSTVSQIDNYIHLGEVCAEIKSYVKKKDGSNLATCKRSKKR